LANFIGEFLFGRRFRYLRGINGVQEGRKEANKQKQKNKEKDKIDEKQADRILGIRMNSGIKKRRNNGRSYHPEYGSSFLC